MAENNRQLSPITYGSFLSNLLTAYYRAPDHLLKQRLLSYFELIFGFKRIVVNTAYGFKFAVDKRDMTQRRILYEGIYEPEVSTIFMQNLKSDDVFYDVGANVGYYSCLASNIRVNSVVAFDPDPINCQIIALNSQLNNFDMSNLRIVQKGLGDKSKTSSWYRADVSNTGISGFELKNALASFDVEVDTIDYMITRDEIPPPSVIKIDVEGWEENVIKGASTLLSDSPPRIIVFEAECGSDGVIINQSIIKILEKYGYNINWIHRFNGTIEGRENYMARLELS